MAMPWEKYAASTQQAGPWAKYGEPKRFGSGKSFDVADDGSLVPSGSIDYAKQLEASRGNIEAGEGTAKVATAIPASILANLGGLGALAYDITANGIMHPLSGSTPGDYADPAKVKQSIANYLTYQPRDPNSLSSKVTDFPGRVITESGKELSALTGTKDVPYLGSIVEALPEAAANYVGMKGISPAAVTNKVPYATAGAREIPMPVPARTPASVLASNEKSAAANVDQMQAALNSKFEGQSMGAASSAPNVAAMSPELQSALMKVMGGRKINQQAVIGQSRADALPVPIQLTEGQATQNVSTLSREQNLRGKHAELANRFDEQNKKLAQNLQAVRDQAGPDVFTTNATEHADTLIASYKSLDDRINAGVSAKYKKLREAAGGSFPIDTKALLGNVRAALKKDLSTNSAPADVMSFLEETASKGMTLEDFESLRTSLARIQRSASDGQVRHAAGVIRRQVEDLPLQGNAQVLKGLADDARSAARDRFKMLEEDPAFKAAVEDSVTPDRFVQKYIVGGSRDNLERMARNIGNDPGAKQTISVAVMDYLRDQARLSSNFEGNFSAAGFNKAMQGLSPKIRHLVDSRVAEILDSIGQVARDTTYQPRGSFVNNSNTLVGALAEGGVSAVEGAANFAAKGIPVGTLGRKLLESRATKKDVRRYIAPGAGIDK